MTDESYFRNHFHASEIRTFIQAGVIEMRPPEAPRPMEVALPPNDWVDRESLLDQIRRHLDEDPRTPVLVTGPSGAGKSALAAKIASSTGAFPDGQLYIDLEHEDLQSAARSALLRLGIAKDFLADTFGGLLAQFRSVTSSKAMLVVVDGAEDAVEGLHFAPASARSALAVFGLRSTADPSARHFALPDLDAEDACRLLASATGSADDGSLQLVRQYGTRPETVRRLAGLIRARSAAASGDHDAIVRDLLEYPTPDLLEATYRTLSESAAWLYRLLSVLPAPQFEQSVLDLFDTPGDSGRAFEELVNAQLVTLVRPGWCQVEPSVSRDAARRAEVESLSIDLVTAMRTTLRWYVKRAQLADRKIMGERLRRAPMPGEVHAEPFADAAEALTWFRANHIALSAAIRMAALHSWNDEAWALAEAMWAFYTNVPHPEEAAHCYEEAVAATTRPLDRARMLLFLGRVRLDLGRFADAEGALRESLALASEGKDGELVESATALLGRAAHWQGRYEEAIARYTEALRTAETGGRARAAAIQLMYLGRAHRELGALDTALEFFKRAQAAFLAIKDRRHVLLVEADAAVVGVALGLPGSIEVADRAIDWLHEVGYARHEGAVQERLGAALEGEEGRARFEAAIEAYERAGSLAEARRVRRMLPQPYPQRGRNDVEQ